MFNSTNGSTMVTFPVIWNEVFEIHRTFGCVVTPVMKFTTPVNSVDCISAAQESAITAVALVYEWVATSRTGHHIVQMDDAAFVPRFSTTAAAVVCVVIGWLVQGVKTVTWVLLLLLARVKEKLVGGVGSEGSRGGVASLAAIAALSTLFLANDLAISKRIVHKRHQRTLVS